MPPPPVDEAEADGTFDEFGARRVHETHHELASSDNLERIRNIGEGGVQLDASSRDADSIRKGLVAPPIKPELLSPGIVDDAGAGLLLNDRSLLELSTIANLESSFLNSYKRGRARSQIYSEELVRSAFPQAIQRFVLAHEQSYDVEQYRIVVHVFFVQAPLFLYCIFHKLPSGGQYTWSGHRYIEGVVAATRAPS